MLSPTPSATTSSTRLKPRLAEILGDAPSCMSHLYQFRVRSGTLDLKFSQFWPRLHSDAMPMSDQELMHEVASGNEAAFGELYDRFGKLVFVWLGSFSESIRVRRCCSGSVYTSLADS